jgi:FKBP-type peptidyl-prolyl cis-trans isomerase
MFTYNMTTMTKQKLGVVVGSSVLAVALVGGGVLLGKIHLLTHKTALHASAAVSGEGDASQNSVPLNESQSASGSTSGLSVSSGGATSLGQLGTNGQSGQSATQGSSQGSSSGPSPVDPATFSQYEKYKDESHALFGDIQVGNGDEVTANKKAAVFYKGWLTNGQLFDESRPGSDGKLQPFVFTLGAHQVIPGWEEAVAGMKVGGSRLIVVPPSVGYGSTGQGNIPPNSVLVFQVQLAAVQ